MKTKYVKFEDIKVLLKKLYNEPAYQHKGETYYAGIAAVDMELNSLSTMEIIEKAPAADMSPVVHGEWKRYRDKWCCSYVCSVCKKPAIYGISYEPRLSNYCPNCGAKMKGN